VNEARFCASCGAALPTRVESQQDPLIGQIIGNRYRITGVIGEGGMGVVYVGEQQMGSTVRKVAVKTLHQHLSKDANVLKRFHRECGTVAQLEHPNTIKVYDFGSTPDGTLYIAMEFVAGKPLSDVLLNEGKLAPERVVQIMRQVCGALDEAHQLGIVHRDLKPDNVILAQRAGEQDFVKVLDFGIAARTESADAAHEQKLTQQGTVLGTPPYMSPEQFTGKPLDRRSDVYSLGVMVYEMLTGKLPFDAETPWQWATQHMTAQPKSFDIVAPNARIPEGMRQAIMRALSKEPAQRQPTAGEFFAELSSGQRLSGEATAPAAPSALPYQATAAMPEMPGFAPTPAAAAPAFPTPVGSTMATPAVAPAAVMAAPVPFIAGPKPKGGGKTGLVVGLVGAGLAGVAVLVVVLVRNNRPTDDPAALVSAAAASASAATGAPAAVSAEIPQDTGTQVAVLNPTVAPTRENPQPRSTGKATGTHTGTGTGTGTGTATIPPPQPSSVPNPIPTPSTPAQPPQPPANQDAACLACIASAGSGDISGAASKYAACSNSALKQQCASTASRGASLAGRAANGDCTKIKSIKNSLASMGANSAPINAAAAKCP